MLQVSIPGGSELPQLAKELAVHRDARTQRRTYTQTHVHTDADTQTHTHSHTRTHRKNVAGYLYLMSFKWRTLVMRF